MPGYHHASVVALGSFNPAIFQPDWFRHNDLLPASEIDFATAEMPRSVDARRRTQRVFVANDAAHVEFESLQLEVLQDRWILATERPDWQGDLGKIAHDIFAQLPHTPVRIIGFNIVIHARPKRPADDVLGELLPLGALGEIAGTDAGAAATVKAAWEGWRVTLTLDRSAKLNDALFLAQNFERDIGHVEELLPVLVDGWRMVLARAKVVADTIMREHTLG